MPPSRRSHGRACRCAASSARIAAIAFAVVTGGAAIWANYDGLTGRSAASAEMLLRVDALFARASVLMSIIVPAIVAFLALPRPLCRKIV